MQRREALQQQNVDSYLIGSDCSECCSGFSGCIEQQGLNEQMYSAGKDR